MDGYQFTADIFKSLVSLAWPTAIVAIVYMFKARLTELLPFLDLRYKDFQLSLKKAEAKAETLPEVKQPTLEAEDNEFEKLLKVSPAAAVVHMRRVLEQALQTYAELRGMTRIPLGLYRLARELGRENLIDPNTTDVLVGLAQTAAAASHSSAESISQSDAERFRDVAERVMRGLEVLGAAATMSPPGPVG